MDWANPSVLLWILPAALLIWLAQRRSLHPMSDPRKRLLLLVRIAALGVLLLALAAPARRIKSRDESVLFILDHSRSLGVEGLQGGGAPGKRTPWRTAARHTHRAALRRGQHPRATYRQ